MSQEFAKRLPAFRDIKLEQSFGRYQTANFLEVIKVNLFALVRKIAAEECVEEFIEHRIIHACGPAEFRNEFVFGISRAPVYSSYC